MKIRILNRGYYSTWVEGKAKATYRARGDEVELPGWYAKDLITSGHAEDVVPFEDLPNATPAALKLAGGWRSLKGIEGTGKDGRITLRDVRRAMDIE